MIIPFESKCMSSRRKCMCRARMRRLVEWKIFCAYLKNRTEIKTRAESFFQHQQSAIHVAFRSIINWTLCKWTKRLTFFVKCSTYWKRYSIAVHRIVQLIALLIHRFIGFVDNSPYIVLFCFSLNSFSVSSSTIEKCMAWEWYECLNSFKF